MTLEDYLSEAEHASGENVGSGMGRPTGGLTADTCIPLAHDKETYPARKQRCLGYR